MYTACVANIQWKAGLHFVGCFSCEVLTNAKLTYAEWTCGGDAQSLLSLQVALTDWCKIMHEVQNLGRYSTASPDRHTHCSTR